MAQIAWIGLHAQCFVRRHTRARVAAVFARSLHLAAGNDFLCIGDSSIGNGPLNAIVAPGDWTRLGTTTSASGTWAHIDGNAIRAAPAVFHLAGARSWSPDPWPPATDLGGLAAALNGLKRLARERAPADGLARTALGWPADRDTALQRIAGAKLDLLRDWLESRRAPAAAAPPPVDLLGLGPGLTPSGDDLLCGLLVALHATRQIEAARDFAAAIAKVVRCATSPLSGAFLRAAGDGLGCEALHAAIVALLQDRAAAVARQVAVLDRIGATSGWDALAGAVLGLQAAVPVQTPSSDDAVRAHARVAGDAVARQVIPRPSRCRRPGAPRGP